MKVMLMASREVRTIPRGWQHPRDERGQYVPLLSDWEGSLAYRAEHPEYYGPDSDEPPMNRDGYMPDVEGEPEIMAYETVSEGTPMSPAFPNTPEGKLALLSWCANNCSVPGTRDQRTDIEAWSAILFGTALIDVQTNQVVNQLDDKDYP